MNEFVNGKDDTPYMKWTIKFMFQTTNQYILAFLAYLLRHFEEHIFSSKSRVESSWVQRNTAEIAPFTSCFTHISLVAKF